MKVKYFFFIMAITSIIFVSCTAPYKKSMQSGDRALQQEDYREAFFHYQSACENKPGSIACKKAKRAKKKAIKKITARAGRLCAKERYLHCAEALRPALDIAPQHPKVKSFVKLLSPHLVDTCNKRKGQKTKIYMLPKMLDELRCLKKSKKLLPNTMHQQKAQDRISLLATSIFMLGLKVNKDNYLLRAYLEGLASCIKPNIHSECAHLDDYEKSLQQVTTVLRSKVNNTSEDYNEATVCQMLVKQAPGSLRCASPGQRADITLLVQVTEPKIMHSSTSETKRVRYKTGSDLRNNPARAQAEMRYERAERNYRGVEQETIDRKARCESTGSNYACAQYNAIVDTYNNRQRELQDATRNLNNTPSTYSQDIYNTRTYQIRHHKWIAEYQISISLNSSQPYTEKQSLQYFDDETAGVPEAGVQPRSIKPPLKEYFAKESWKEAVDKMATMLDDELLERAKEFATNCTKNAKGDFAASLACEARANVMYGISMFGKNGFRLYKILGGGKLTCTNIPNIRRVGISFDDVTAKKIVQAGLANQGAVLIKRVSRNSAADYSNLRAGDLVLSISGHIVRSPQNAGRLLKLLINSNRHVVFRVWRDGRIREYSLAWPHSS